MSGLPGVPTENVLLVSDAQCRLRTSSNYNDSTTSFNTFIHNSNAPGWCAATNDLNQFIIAGCEKPRTITHVILRGRPDLDQWVTSYKIRYSIDNLSWIDYKNGQAITGCADRNTFAIHQLETPIRARTIAIHPLTWNNHISLRFDLSAKPVYDYQAETIRNDTRGNQALNGGTGHREAIVPVVFSSTFNSVPTVTVSLASFDCYQSTERFFGVKQMNVTKTGFDLVFYAWGNTRLQGLSSNYVAIQKE
ncbi:hypothetical protein ACTFIV_006567 [Dictyostelium citrinum]